METRLAFRYGGWVVAPSLKGWLGMADDYRGMFPKRVWLILLVVEAVMSGAVGASRASLLRAMNLAELTVAADRIVVGSVVSVGSAWDLHHRRIISTIEVAIEETWKGGQTGNQRLTIVQPGGSVGDIEMSVGGMPSFSVGEKSLLFLRGQHQYQVAGMSQGKRALRWDRVGKQWFAEAPDSEGMVEVGPDARLRQARRPVPIPLSDLRQLVQQVIGHSP